MIKSDEPPRISEHAGMWKGRLLKFSSLDSTHRWAAEHIDELDHGDVVWAVRQTAGIGRLSRMWHSAEDRGLAVSFVLMDVPREPLMPMLGQAAALAVQSALEEYSIDAAVKWPNDVLVQGRKIAGILSIPDLRRNAIALGIGINVNQTVGDWQETDLTEQATSMRMETGVAHRVEHVLHRLIAEMAITMDAVFAQGASWIVEKWKACDRLLGNRVSLDCADGMREGEYLGLDGRGRLRLREDNGRECVFWSGEVHKTRRKAGDED